MGAVTTINFPPPITLPYFLLKCHLNAVEMHMKENIKTEEKFIVFKSLFNMNTCTPADLSSSNNERR
ncbi:hypothetical protein BK009_01050 [Methanobacterium subterraneum]|uniref:Uncharacterized protein n=1 Tax=Methanobacterium subterraneum TaxID=59277 RepID=A0A2H4VMR2_9EURY|nr:hypothetical protein BK009_01050 [Methanobacterium subterraneum]